MKIVKQLLAAGLLLASTYSHATLITYETQAFTGNFSMSDLMTEWYARGGAQTSQALTSFEQVYSGNYTFSRLIIDVSMAEAGVWTLEAGLDAGFGAQMYVDGVSVLKDPTNIWWKYNWNHEDVIRVEDISLNTGKHKIELFWLENCCNGYNSVRLIDQTRSTISFLSVNAVQAAQGQAQIPEPYTYALFGVGLLALGSRVGRKASPTP
ncbi:CCXG family PEP-CTERM protein [Thalassotalea euphylliae]|uniref:CCXG family PEP-CTERM protein n=1 Tax=Thalassotalea euphylliae TaxID=1655234 RepID=UPI00363236F0